jgi:hypothetical protein
MKKSKNSQEGLIHLDNGRVHVPTLACAMQDTPSGGLLKVDAILAVGEGLCASNHETALGLPADDEILAPLLDKIAESKYTTLGALDPGWVVYTKRTGQRVAINILVKHLVLDEEQAQVLT